MPPWLDRLAAFIARGWPREMLDRDPVEDREFDELALAVHAWQADHIPEIARLAFAPVRTWRDIPAVPVSLFAEHDLFAWPVTQATGLFRSSGTTRERRGRHWHRDLSLYRAACLGGARWALRGETSAWRVRSLMPDDPESSLGSMIEGLTRDLAPSAGVTNVTPVLVVGPAFAYVPFIERGERERLPPGSVVVETGGFKGRTREIRREDLHAGIGAVFDVPASRIIGEYGMCELSTPLWERIGDDARGLPADRGFMPAPWVRVRLLDPETMQDADRGIVAIWDLANWQSSLAILTADLGHWNEQGRLVIEGRLPGAMPKGCSIAVS